MGDQANIGPRGGKLLGNYLLGGLHQHFVVLERVENMCSKSRRTPSRLTPHAVASPVGKRVSNKRASIH